MKWREEEIKGRASRSKNVSLFEKEKERICSTHVRQVIYDGKEWN